MVQALLETKEVKKVLLLVEKSSVEMVSKENQQDLCDEVDKKEKNKKSTLTNPKYSNTNNKAKNFLMNLSY